MRLTEPQAKLLSGPAPRLLGPAPGLPDTRVSMLENNVEPLVNTTNSMTAVMQVQNENAGKIMQDKMTTIQKLCEGRSAEKGAKLREITGFDHRKQVRPDQLSAAEPEELLAWDALLKSYFMSLDTKWEKVIQNIRKRSAESWTIRHTAELHEWRSSRESDVMWL